jgi:hypothetical protein
VTVRNTTTILLTVILFLSVVGVSQAQIIGYGEDAQIIFNDGTILNVSCCQTFDNIYVYSDSVRFDLNTSVNILTPQNNSRIANFSYVDYNLSFNMSGNFSVDTKLNTSTNYNVQKNSVNDSTFSTNSTGWGLFWISSTSLADVLVYKLSDAVDTTPPASITNLANTTTPAFYINWTWTNPSDSDFNHTEIYIDGSFITNTSNQYYNDSYSVRATVTIGTHTVDTSNNVNTTWINQTTTIPNNPITITNTSDFSGSELETVTVDFDYTDADGDVGVFSTNRSDLFVDFDTTNGTGSWTTTLSDAGTYYVDFGVSDENGSVSNYTMTIIISEYGEPSPPTNLTNTTGNFWVNHTWDSGSNTDSFNITVNNNWYNGTTATFNNTTSVAHGWVNISVAGYNNTGNLSDYTSQNTRVPNNPIVLTNTSNWSALSNVDVYFDFDYTDADGDTGTFDTNATNGTLNTTTGVFTWSNPVVGTYYWLFNVSDGYGGVDSFVANITVTNLNNFSFTNITVPSPVKERETSNVEVDVNDSDGMITIVLVKIDGINFTMTQQSGDTWRYQFSSAIVNKHYVTNFYAQDNDGAWNSTTSSLYIDVVSSTGGGGGWIRPPPTPTVTVTPTPTITPVATEKPPIDFNLTNVTEDLKNTTDFLKDIVSVDGISMIKLNTDVGDVKFIKELYRDDVLDCRSSDPRVNCGVLDGKITIVVRPNLTGWLYNRIDSHITIITRDEKTEYTPFTIIVLDAMGYLVVDPFTLDNPNPYLFEVEHPSQAVVGVRYWWIGLLIGVGLWIMRKRSMGKI